MCEGKTLKARRARAGRPPSGRAPFKKDLLRLYIRGGKSIRDVAKTLEVSKDMVYRALRSHGIEAREHVRKTNLWSYSKNSLEEGIREKGLRGFARELGVNESTLRYHLRTARISK
jgi:transposase-like protein